MLFLPRIELSNDPMIWTSILQFIRQPMSSAVFEAVSRRLQHLALSILIKDVSRSTCRKRNYDLLYFWRLSGKAFIWGAVLRLRSLPYLLTAPARQWTKNSINQCRNSMMQLLPWWNRASSCCHERTGKHHDARHNLRKKPNQLLT